MERGKEGGMEGMEGRKDRTGRQTMLFCAQG